MIFVYEKWINLDIGVLLYGSLMFIFIRQEMKRQHERWKTNMHLIVEQMFGIRISWQ